MNINIYFIFLKKLNIFIVGFFLFKESILKRSYDKSHGNYENSHIIKALK